METSKYEVCGRDLNVEECNRLLTYSEEGEALTDPLWVLGKTHLGQRDDVPLTATHEQGRKNKMIRQRDM